MSSINSVSSSTNAYQADTQNAWKKRGQDFKALQSALQSGNLSGAQQAFATLQKDLPSASQADGTSTSAAFGTASTTASGQTTNPFQALQSALSSGNLSAAQQAFATMQQSLQNAAVGAAGHHHHHHGGSMDNSSQTTSSGSSSTSAQTLSSSLNVLA